MKCPNLSLKEKDEYITVIDISNKIIYIPKEHLDKMFDRYRRLIIEILANLKRQGWTIVALILILLILDIYLIRVRPLSELF
jgi:hypothetical protein